MQPLNALKHDLKVNPLSPAMTNETVKSPLHQWALKVLIPSQIDPSKKECDLVFASSNVPLDDVFNQICDRLGKSVLEGKVLVSPDESVEVSKWSVLEDDFALECLLIDAADKATNSSSSTAIAYLLDLNEKGEPCLNTPSIPAPKDEVEANPAKRPSSILDATSSVLHVQKIRRIESDESEIPTEDPNNVIFQAAFEEDEMESSLLDPEPNADSSTTATLYDSMDSTAIVTEEGEVSRSDHPIPIHHGPNAPYLNRSCQPPRSPGRDRSNPDAIPPEMPIIQDKLSYVRPVTNLEETINMLRRWIREGPLKEEVDQQVGEPDLVQAEDAIAQMVDTIMDEI